MLVVQHNQYVHRLHGHILLSPLIYSVSWRLSPSFSSRSKFILKTCYPYLFLTGVSRGGGGASPPSHVFQKLEHCACGSASAYLQQTKRVCSHRGGVFWALDASRMYMRSGRCPLPCSGPRISVLRASEVHAPPRHNPGHATVLSTVLLISACSACILSTAVLTEHSAC